MARVAASPMCGGVSKSGSPISIWMTFRPRASMAVARVRTSNADSVPNRPIRLANSGKTDLHQTGQRQVYAVKKAGRRADTKPEGDEHRLP
jgi:hypothetical protein